MRRSSFLVPFVCLVAGCAHEDDLPELAVPRVTSAVASEREVIAVDSLTAEPVASRPRPRLDHVVTLGETTLEPYTPAQPAAAGSNGTVVINNNITVNGSNPGYYGGYGYGGGYHGGSSYGGPRGTGGGTTTRVPELGTAAQSAPARPGQTPGVGGNWPTIPSYGPRQMR